MRKAWLVFTSFLLAFLLVFPCQAAFAANNTLYTASSKISASAPTITPSAKDGFAIGWPNQLKITTKLNSSSPVSIKAEILNAKGMLVASIGPLQNQKSGTKTFYWNGKATAGNKAKLKAGSYAPASSAGTSYKVRIVVTEAKANPKTVTSNTTSFKAYTGLKITSTTISNSKFTALPSGANKAKIGFKLSRTSNAEVWIYNSNKSKVYAKLKLAYVPAKKMKYVYWDGKATAGNTAGLVAGALVPKGQYRAVIYAAKTSKTVATVLNVARLPIKKVGVSLPLVIPFYSMLSQGLDAAAQKMGMQLVLKDNEIDVAKLVSQIDSFRTSKLDGIVLVNLDETGTKNAIDKAVAAGIPVVTIFGTSASGSIVSNICSDDYNGGKLQGAYIGEYFKNASGTVQVAMITGFEGTPSSDDRKNGVIKSFSSYPKISLVAVQQGEWDNAKAMTLAENFIYAYPDLKAIICLNDGMALAVLQTVKASGQDIKVIGFDGIPEAIQEIKKGGKLIATVAQDTMRMGSTALQAISDSLAGKMVKPQIVLSPYIVDIHNAK
jgi:ribose transport system substrate-binding protein